MSNDIWTPTEFGNQYTYDNDFYTAIVIRSISMEAWLFPQRKTQKDAERAANEFVESLNYRKEH